MSEIDFWVSGEPRPGGSKKGFFNAKLKRVIITEDNARSKDWRASVAQAAAEVAKEVLDGPLAMRMDFVFVRPKGHLRKDGSVRPAAPPYPSVRPDATKLLRSTEDALKGILWRDDCQVVTQAATKRYGQQAGARIRVRVETA